MKYGLKERGLGRHSNASYKQCCQLAEIGRNNTHKNISRRKNPLPNFSQIFQKVADLF
jgi:hypothetical protein